MPSFTASLATIGDVSVPHAPARVGDLRDAELLDAQRTVAEVRRRLDAVAAAVAGEIAHRSRRELGHSGLAQSQGSRTPEALISQLAGTSTREARTLVRAGELLPFDTPRENTPPQPRWVTVIGAAVSAALMSTEAAEIIRTRLAQTSAAGADTASDDIAALEATTRALVAEAPGLTIEQLAIRASRARDELDLAGIATREEQQREARFLRVFRQLDGMTRITALLDAESAAVVVPILDAATSPRRGGPRFVDPGAVERAEELVPDQRTTEQLALDTLIELVRIGARVDKAKHLGENKPAVRILVTQHDLAAPAGTDGHRPGPAYFEGQGQSVSIATAERFICESGAIPILFDPTGRQALNLGRTRRLFSAKQRIALAARDGGCLMCDRPPSWCEAHHIDHWDEHHGQTDLRDGVLLCRFCHLLVHNRGWRIVRQHTDYSLERPDEHGTIRSTPLPSRSLALERLRATGSSGKKEPHAHHQRT